MNSQTPQPPDPRILVWFGWGLLTFGLPMFLFGIYFALLADESRSWPRVEGTVTSASVRTHVSVGQNGRAFSDSDRTYYPEWLYTYTVDGQTFSSSRFSLGESAPNHSEREDARRAAIEHPAGSKVDVFYDPADPSSAVLLSGATTGSWVPLLMGLFFAGSGWAVLKAGRKVTKNASQEK